MFYTYNQNNSGGRFHSDDRVAEYVIIEANAADEADIRAMDVGIYFDGVREGRDCGCCGDRWHQAYGDGTLEPEIYGEDPAEAESFKKNDQTPYCHVYYLDGSVKSYTYGKRHRKSGKAKS